jgi:hypothetical protein
VLMMFGFIGQSCGSDPGGDGDGAIAYCHQFVEDRLKLPDTADFPGFSDHQVTETGAQRWRVEAWVEGENSFGGTVRTDWTCEISYNEAAESWKLWSLKGL